MLRFSSWWLRRVHVQLVSYAVDCTNNPKEWFQALSVHCQRRSYDAICRAFLAFFIRADDSRFFIAINLDRHLGRTDMHRLLSPHRLLPIVVPRHPTRTLPTPPYRLTNGLGRHAHLAVDVAQPSESPFHQRLVPLPDAAPDPRLVQVQCIVLVARPESGANVPPRRL